MIYSNSTESNSDLHSRLFRHLLSKERQLLPDEDLSIFEREYLCIAHFDAEVRNGGLAQFFTNPYGKTYARVLQALRSIGAEAQASLIDEFLSHVPEGINPGDRNQMGTFLFGPGCPAESLDHLNDQYYDLSESMEASMIRSARNAGLIRYHPGA